MLNFVLASRSLGRQKLLNYLTIPFKVIESDINEEKIIAGTPLQTLRLRARLKAEDVVKKLTSAPGTCLILSADSGAVLDNRLIGKPRDHADAVRMLTLLSGRTHRFVTAVNIIRLQNNITKTIIDSSARSKVTFRRLSRREISNYLSITDYPRYAGSYALISAQDFITRVEGSLSNVIGLPLELVIPVFNKYYFP